MDINSEQFEELLGEALRAGPGSPAWRQAVDTLQTSGSAGDEYSLLCRAREDLASGREYRAVHAGPGFTKKLMTNIEQEVPTRWSVPTANIVAIASVTIVTLTVVLGAWLMFSPAKGLRSGDELLDTYFVDAVVNENFQDAAPKGLMRIGILPVDAGNGAQVQVQTRQTEKHIGGGFVLQAPVPADDVCAVEIAIEIDRGDTDLITQLFVSDRPDFAADTGVSPHELAYLIEQGSGRVVLPEGKTAGEAALAKNTSAVTMRIRLNRDSAAVEQNGKLLWSGAHHLSPTRERYVGVRYLTRGGEKSTGVTVKYFKLIKP